MSNIDKKTKISENWGGGGVPPPLGWDTSGNSKFPKASRDFSRRYEGL